MTAPTADASTDTATDTAQTPPASDGAPLEPPRFTVGPYKTLTVTYSARVTFPRYHLDPDCAGLERTPTEARTSRRFSGAYKLGEDTDGRPCRMCALEPTLIAVCKPRGNASRQLVTFTSQPSPDSPDTAMATYKWSVASESGQARLLRVAAALGLESTHAPGCGQVAFGAISRRSVPILGRNLRTWLLDGPASEVTTDAVETLWTILSDTTTASRAGAQDSLWRAAKLLSAP